MYCLIRPYLALCKPGALHCLVAYVRLVHLGLLLYACSSILSCTLPSFHLRQHSMFLSCCVPPSELSVSCLPAGFHFFFDIRHAIIFMSLISALSLIYLTLHSLT